MERTTVSVEHVLFLAWAGLRRTGVVDRELSFDDFLDLADVPEAGHRWTLPFRHRRASRSGSGSDRDSTVKSSSISTSTSGR
jgi:hypothetical protein